MFPFKIRFFYHVCLIVFSVGLCVIMSGICPIVRSYKDPRKRYNPKHEAQSLLRLVSGIFFISHKGQMCFRIVFDIILTVHAVNISAQKRMKQWNVTRKIFLHVSAFTHLHFLQSSSASFLQKTRDTHKDAEFHLLMERFTIYQQLQNRDKLLLSDGRFDYFLCHMKNNGRRDEVNERRMEG